MSDANNAPRPQRNTKADHHYRFHMPHVHLGSVFGDDWFALKAESFARFFGTPTFLIAQTLIVAVWIAVNMLGFTKFDVYPFILSPAVIKKLGAIHDFVHGDKISAAP